MKQLLTITCVLFFLCFYVACKYDKSISDFGKSEFERGAMFAVNYHTKYKEYPSYYNREKAFLNQPLVIDKIVFESFSPYTGAIVNRPIIDSSFIIITK
jgi:hypothetical protein